MVEFIENLLDGRIRGTLTDFYSIKPEFILSLSLEEQKNMADSISGGREDLQKSQKMYDYFHSIGQDKPKLRDTILSCNESLSLISERNREIKKGGQHNPKSPESMSFKEQLKGQTYSSNEIARVDADTVMEPVVEQPVINQPTTTGYEMII